MFSSRCGTVGWRGVSLGISVFLAVAISFVVAYFAAPMGSADAQAGHDHGAEDGGFQVSTVFGGLTEPTAVEFSGDGRVFVAEKSGIIKVFDGLDDAEPTIFADLTTNVHSYFDRGLIGMTLHPDFPEDPRIYVSYTHDAPIGEAAPVWNDCADRSDQINNNCIVGGNLSTITANADKADGLEMVGGEDVLINDWCQKFPFHSVGDIEFGADGALYMSGGEGADANGADYGQFDDGACGDPENEGGALRSQDLRTGGDPAGLSGTLIRVDPDTGDALPDNPAFTAPDDNESRIIAHGFRNPFRLAMSSGSNDVWVGNVGWFRWEEIDHVPESRKVGSEFGEVPNYGWPCYEGGFREPGYEAAGIPICEELYEEEPGNVVDPHIAWRHCDPVFSIQPCEAANVSSSTSGHEFYEGGAYPSRYDGSLFFADGPRGKVWMAPKGSDGLPDPDRIHTILDDTKGYVVDLKNGPGGEMYMVQVYGEGFGPGRIAKITQGPVANIETDKTFGVSPLTVNFDATPSTDPAGRELSYAWDLDGDGDFDDSTEAAPSFTYTGSENFVVRVKVANTAGQEATESVTIYPDNTPPTANVNFVGVLERDEDGNVTGTKPAEGWKVGDEIAFNGFGLDEEDEMVETGYGTTLPTDSVRWDTSIFHCYSANDCHRHPLNGFGVGAGGGGTVTAPNHDFPSHLELTMTVTDSRGLESSETLRLDPRTVDLTFDSNVPGVPITYGGKTEAGPSTREAIVGSTSTVSAPRTAETPGGATRNFESWSDGGARSHAIVAPEEDIRYTANYENTPPTANVNFVGVLERDEDGSITGTKPAEGWKVGDEIAFNGFGLDEEDEMAETGYGTTLPTDSARWDVSLVLCPGGGECESRLVRSFANSGGGGIITAPDAEHPARLEFKLTVTDSQGLEGEATETRNPRTVNLTFDSDPAGVNLGVGGANEATPFDKEVIVGSRNAVEAPETAEVAGVPYRFESWSDEGARSRDIVAPGEDARYTANYENAAALETAIGEKPSELSGSRTARFTFTSSKADSTFECSLDGAAFSECPSPKEYGGLADGEHTFAVRAVDRAGSKDPTPAGYSWTIDATPPDTSITSGPSGTVRSSSATFSFTSTEGGSTFECRLGVGQFQPCQSPHTLQNLTRGTHTFAVRAVDRAGNVDATPATRRWTVNGISARITPLAPRHLTQTRVRAPLMRAVVSHPERAIPKRNVMVFVNGSPRTFAYNPRNGLITISRTNLPPRWNAVRVFATDGLGNTSTRLWRFRTIR